MRARVPIVLLIRVRIRVNDRLLAEHLPVLFVFRQASEVSDLGLDFRFNFAKATAESLWRQPTLFTVVVGEPGLSLILGDEVAAVRS